MVWLHKISFLGWGVPPVNGHPRMLLWTEQLYENIHFAQSVLPKLPQEWLGPSSFATLPQVSAKELPNFAQEIPKYPNSLSDLSLSNRQSPDLTFSRKELTEVFRLPGPLRHPPWRSCTAMHCDMGDLRFSAFFASPCRRLSLSNNSIDGCRKHWKLEKVSFGEFRSTPEPSAHSASSCCSP